MDFISLLKKKMVVFGAVFLSSITFLPSHGTHTHTTLAPMQPYLQNSMQLTAQHKTPTYTPHRLRLKNLYNTIRQKLVQHPLIALSGAVVLGTGCYISYRILNHTGTFDRIKQLFSPTPPTQVTPPIQLPEAHNIQPEIQLEAPLQETPEPNNVLVPVLTYSTPAPSKVTNSLSFTLKNPRILDYLKSTRTPFAHLTLPEGLSHISASLKRNEFTLNLTHDAMQNPYELFHNLWAANTKAIQSLGIAMPSQSLPHCNAYEILRACIENEFDRLPILFKQGAMVNTQTSWLHRTPLHMACNKKNIEAVKFLLSQDALVNTQDYWGDSALTLLLSGPEGDPNISIITKLLLQHGANPNLLDDDGDTPLLKRSLTGFISSKKDCNQEHCQALLTHNANANARNKDGQTPLYLTKDPFIAWKLLEKGAHLNPRDHQNQTPLSQFSSPRLNWDFAFGEKSAPKKNAPFPDLFNSPKAMLHYLIQEHANLSATDHIGNTPLHQWANDDKALPELFAAFRHHKRNLIAPLLIKNKYGFTPLDIATQNFGGKSGKVQALYKACYPSVGKAKLTNPAGNTHYVTIFFCCAKKYGDNTTDCFPLRLAFLLFEQTGIVITTKSMLSSALQLEKKTKRVLPVPIEKWHCKELSANWILLIPDPEKKITPKSINTVLTANIPSQEELNYGVWIDHLSTIATDEVKKFSTPLIPSNDVKPEDTWTLTKELITVLKGNRLFTSKDLYTKKTAPHWVLLSKGHGTASYIQTINNKTYNTAQGIFRSYAADIRTLSEELCNRINLKLWVVFSCFCGGLNTHIFPKSLPTTLIFCTSGNARIQTGKIPLYDAFFDRLAQELTQKKPRFNKALSSLFSMPNQLAPAPNDDILFNIPLIKYPHKKPKPLSQSGVILIKPLPINSDDEDGDHVTITYTPHPLKTCPCVIALGTEYIERSIYLVEKFSGLIPPIPDSKIGFKLFREKERSSTINYPQEVPLIISRVPGPAFHTIEKLHAPACKASAFAKALLLPWEQEHDEKALTCKKLIVQDDLFSQKLNGKYPLKTFSIYLINKKLAKQAKPNEQNPTLPTTQALLITKDNKAVELVYDDKASTKICTKALEEKSLKNYKKKYTVLIREASKLAKKIQTGVIALLHNVNLSVFGLKLFGTN
ncbi:MAG: hypothetical protein UW09_C0002G0042 [candidate division TM6 bacterium GW2011_GWF2_43_87]|nr:MAG: hypothetical protein UW09_C0002G0042 [candidate division TM6 bacterium GW2011_GWF2_43_87]